jgi:hypothetical protein
VPPSALSPLSSLRDHAAADLIDALSWVPRQRPAPKLDRVIASERPVPSANPASWPSVASCSSASRASERPANVWVCRAHER